MSDYEKSELNSALQFVTKTISKCEKMQNKFAVGTPQHSLLKNRIKALYISKALILNDDTIAIYSDEELTKALAPITSIINKTIKAQSKYEKDSAQYKKFEPIIQAMQICKTLIENELKMQETE